MRIPFLVALLSVIVSLTGCKVLNRLYDSLIDCKSQNWYDYGYSAGQRVAYDWEELTASCQRQHIAVTEAQSSSFDAGVKAGHAEYCTARFAFKRGHNGGSYDSSDCYGTSSPEDLTDAYNAGLRIYNAKEKYRND